MMRSFALAAAALLASAGAASAQTPQASAPAVVLPHLFIQAGYYQPQISPAMCVAIDAGQTKCTLPAMTAGRYYAEASDDSTATADGAAQRIVIVAGNDDRVCQATRSSDPKAPWAVGARQSLKAGCLITVVSDGPMDIRAIYADAKATRDPKGPSLTLRPVPWTGAMDVVAIPLKQ
jgi:hypothetical protein